jgi:hypothetical protein
MPCPRVLVLRLGRPGPVGWPGEAGLALVAGPVDSRGDLIRISLERATPEEILAACLAAGLRITGSRVERVDARLPGGLALAP